jgi:hypothetical protein
MRICSVCLKEDLLKGEVVCEFCAQKLPLPLILAAESTSSGPFALGLRNGAVIWFARACFHGEFVSVFNGQLCAEESPSVAGLPVQPKGELAVRLSEIAWVCETEYPGRAPFTGRAGAPAG